MAVVSKWWQQMIFKISARRLEGAGHALRQRGAKVGVVFSVYPQHRNARRSSKLRGRFDQSIGGAVIVRFAVNMSATTRSKGDNCPYRRRIRTRKRDGSPPAAGLPYDNHLVALDERLPRHVIDDPSIHRRNGKSRITKLRI